MKEFRFEPMVRTATAYAESKERLKAFLIRQSKVAERDYFYTNEDFYSRIVRIVEREISGEKFVLKHTTERLNAGISQLESPNFFEQTSALVTDKSLSDMTEDERNEVIKADRAKRAIEARKQLVDVTEKGDTAIKRLENIKQSIAEILQSNKSTISKPKRQGRPKTVIHDASYYLQNKDLLSFLIENYSNVEPQVFNQLMCVLDEMELLKSATNKEYKESFGEALNVNQTQTNFNDTFRKKEKKIEEIFNPIKNRIKAFLDRD